LIINAYLKKVNITIVPPFLLSYIEVLKKRRKAFLSLQLKKKSELKNYKKFMGDGLQNIKLF
jgi:hypothetical protein